MRLNKIQQAAVTALEDIKATGIAPLDTRTLTSLYDAIIIATAESARQTKALARNVADKVRAAGGRVSAIEGEDSGEWVIVDCGDLVVHIMLPQTRTLYNLEELWTPAQVNTRARPTKVVTKTTAISAAKPSSNRLRSDVAGSKSDRTSASKKPSAPRPAGDPPAAKRPAAKKTATQKKASAKKPATKRSTTSVVAKKPAVKKPATTRVATKKTAAKKPAAKKPATKKAAAKKPAAKKRVG